MGNLGVGSWSFWEFLHPLKSPVRLTESPYSKSVQFGTGATWGSAPPHTRRQTMKRTSGAAARAREDYQIYEEFYGFAEKPFSLTPDPKYLYRSESHANAFE